MIALLIIQTITIAVLIALLFSANKMINDKTKLLKEWRAYAWSLEPYYTEMRDLYSRYGDAIAELKIKSGEIEAHKIIGTKRVYAMELPGMPALPDDRAIAFGATGRPVVVPKMFDYAAKKTSKINKQAIYVNTEAKENEPVSMSRYAAMTLVVNELAESVIAALGRDSLTEAELDRCAELVIYWNSKGYDQSNYANWLAVDLNNLIPSKPSSNNGNGNKNAAKSDSSKASSNGNMYTSDKFGEYLDLLTSHLNLKNGDKIPSAKFEYAKEKYTQWENSKNPSTSVEYAKSVINAKFGGK